MLEMLILLCTAGEPACTKENAIQVIHVPLQQIAVNCSYQSQSYIVQNGIDVTGFKVEAKCRLGGG